MGKVIVIEGSDGSGKATQTKLLYEALTAQGKKVKMCLILVMRVIHLRW